MADFREAQNGHWSYACMNPIIRPDFPLPDIYRDMFKKWGMDID
jgi:hypothetical protein